MNSFAPPVVLTPEEFELEVKSIVDAMAAGLVSYSSKHLERIEASDGAYVIDIVARFSAFGADFVVLIECKHHKRKIEREDVLVLYQKILSAGAHKGLLFSSSGFQSGAIEFAGAHGIATIQIAEGRTAWSTKSAEGNHEPPPWAGLPKYIGWLTTGRLIRFVSRSDTAALREELGLPRGSTRSEKAEGSDAG